MITTYTHNLMESLPAKRSLCLLESVNTYRLHNRFVKKSLSLKWPYELYKGSLMNDFMNVLLSPIS